MIAIDLGSNSFRAITYECENAHFGDAYEAIVKTADGLHKSSKISDDAVERILKALHAANHKLHFSEHTIKAVTTEAMRKAINADMVLERLEKEGGVRFEIIDADQEAHFTLLAVAARLKALEIQSEHFVLIDVGGGSTELIFYRDGVVESRSFPIGIVTTAQICDEGREINAYLQEQFESLVYYVDDYYKRVSKPTALVATAGTPTTMAAYLLGMNYKNYDVEKINGYMLTLQGTQASLDGLMALSEEDRAEIVGVGRESLILAGIVIVQKLYEVLGFKSATVIDDGVREGVAIEYCRAYQKMDELV